MTEEVNYELIKFGQAAETIECDRCEGKIKRQDICAAVKGNFPMPGTIRGVFYPTVICKNCADNHVIFVVFEK